ncbi:MAG: branched-chain amino acid ABC transporter ATP-binding protein/permease [Deltaproteobacteria bacterium]|nr:branched-chain amino acid ABC transporter ATP-binding protein/permease [Deltaproteobacteria bacterium]
MTKFWPMDMRYSLKGIILLVIPLLFITLLAHLFFSDAIQSTLTGLLINLIAVLGLYMFIGTSGVPSFGHVAFMGIAAHIQALLTLNPIIKKMLLPDLPLWLAKTELSLWPALAITVLSVGAFAFVIGIPFSRMGDAATGIVTICFLAIIHNVLLGWKKYTAGFKVLYSIPEYCGLWTACGTAIVIIVVARLFRDSVWGLKLRASREDKAAAQSIGVHVANLRLLAWVASAMVMALAGGLLVNFLTVVSPDQFYLALTFSLIAMLIVGGLSTVSGAVAGAFFMTIVIEILRRIGEGPVIGPIDLPQIHGLSIMGTGAAIMAVMFWKRNGFIPFFEIDERLKEWRKEHSTEPGLADPAEPIAVDMPGTPKKPQFESSKTGLILNVDSVTKNFGGLRALDDVSVSLEPGEILGLIGPNGSGKTTLINVISGTYPPSKGQITFYQNDITNWPAHKIAIQGIGRTFQSIQLFANLTIFENILAGATIKGSSPISGSSEMWVRHLMTQFGLTQYSDRLAGTLPYGQQRALEIARAVAIQCRLLLLDEPAAGMIRHESNQLIEVLRTLQSDFGLSLLVVDHDLQMIMKLCDRVVVLNKGLVIASGTPQEVQKDPRVVEAYIGKKRKIAKSTVE